VLQYQTLTFNDLGGIQTGRALTAYAPRDALLALNGYFDKMGAYTKRKGGEKLNTTAMGAASKGIYYYPEAAKVIIASDANVYASTPATQVATFGAAIKASLTTGGDFSFAKLQGYAFFCNEKDGLFKINSSTTVTNAGIAKPSTSPTAAQAAAGTLANGTYLIAVTYVNASDASNIIESNPCTAVSRVIAAGGGTASISLTSVPVSPDTQTTKRYIYMSAVNGSVLSYNTSINDNTTTTVSITADSAGALLEYDHDVAPTAIKHIRTHRNRMFWIKGGILGWSKEYKPWYFPQGELDQETIYTISVTDNTLTSIEPFFENILIASQDDIWILSGTDETNFRIDRVRSDERRGCVSKKALKIIGNNAFMIGRNGVYMTDGGRAYDITTPIQDYFSLNANDSDYQINKTYLANTIIEYDDEKNIMYVCVPTSASTVNNAILCMDINSLRMGEDGKFTSDWTWWTGFSVLASAYVREAATDRWYRADEYGHILRQDRFDGDGSNITSTATSGGASTLTDTAQSMTVNLYSSIRIDLLDGSNQSRIIASNTATQFTVTVPWTVAPVAGTSYTVGGIKYKYGHSWNDYGNPTYSKRLRYIRPRFGSTGSYPVKIKYGFDFSWEYPLETSVGTASLSLWDVAFWDAAYWDGIFVTQDKLPVTGSTIHKWSMIQVESFTAGQPIEYNGHDKIFQVKGVR
jgi:hypothetical protein